MTAADRPLPCAEPLEAGDLTAEQLDLLARVVRLGALPPWEPKLRAAAAVFRENGFLRVGVRRLRSRDLRLAGTALLCAATEKGSAAAALAPPPDSQADVSG